MAKKEWGRKARIAGATARLEGFSRETNPYPDLRTHDNKITFSRAYRVRWFDAWDKVDKQLSCKHEFVLHDRSNVTEYLYCINCGAKMENSELKVVFYG